MLDQASLLVLLMWVSSKSNHRVFLLFLPGTPPAWRFSDRNIDESRVLIRNDSGLPFRSCPDLRIEARTRSTPPTSLDRGSYIGLDPQSPNNLIIRIYGATQTEVTWLYDHRPPPQGTLDVSIPDNEYKTDKLTLLSETDLTPLMQQFGDAKPIFSVNDNGQIQTLSL